MRNHGVRCLLMGGQACVFYGAAEFSRDVDIAILAEKTQRSKDWPMLERLVEAHWFQNRHQATPQRIHFWLRECRTPEILIELAKQYPTETQALLSERQLLISALAKDLENLAQLLETERQKEVAKDKLYWTPLKKELAQLRLRK